MRPHPSSPKSAIAAGPLVSKAEDSLNTAKGVIYSGPLSSMDLRWDF
uniref:Uncharacterized protein n=1 Tax=Macrostomum lignano TaxID=282301 RepID=A0A1I8GGI2_9PLAT